MPLLHQFLKTPHLDPSVPKNVRPVSNLLFVSKLLERLVARQLTAYLESNGLFPTFQSAYRRNHSTETVLLKIYNDSLQAADNGMVTIMVFLDYSAAFDNVDHSVMLDILERHCGLTDAALQWHKCYLHCRSYAVISGSAMSETTDLECGVPQGSSLGPLKFVAYAADLYMVTSVKQHSFADDTQLYKHTRIGNIRQDKHDVIAAINDSNRYQTQRPEVGSYLARDPSAVGQGQPSWPDAALPVHRS